MSEKDKKNLKDSIQQAELNDDDLDEVAGGELGCWGGCTASCEPGCSQSCAPGGSSGTELQ